MHEVGSLPTDGELVGGAYRVLEVIGRGGMGTVYRAVDVASGRQVALKLMLPHLATPVRMARFAREAEVTARLDRLGGIVRVFASGVHRGAPFFAMELVEGEDLEALLERGPLPVERAVEVVERVARTMGACHAEGVVHRDLKPGNVLIDAIGPKIVDFGLARDESAEQRLTKTGELVGTPFYMPPEQLGGHQADARADVYALGAILYHALTGQPPFVASSLMELAARVNTADPVRPSKLRRGVPADLDAVILRALARHADDRYPDAGALADDLARVQRKERPTASTHTGSWVDVSGIFARARRGDRSAQALVAGLGGAALLAVLTAGLAVGVVAPKRAARAALEETLEWDGDRCERARDACRGGPHRLSAWDLGLGEGPPPTVDELAERAARLERAAARLDGPDVLAARAEAARLSALRALAGDPAATTGASGATAALVQAVEARRRGDVALADDQVARALAQEPGWPAALRLEARLWEDRLARGRRPTVVQKLALWLNARGRTDVERTIARQAAVRGLVGWYVGAIAAALEANVDTATLRAGLDEALAGARALDVLPEVLAALPAEKVAALEVDAERWAGAIAAAAPDERVGVARLGAALRAEPGVQPGPRLLAALRRLAEDLVAAAARAPTDEAVIRAAALDDAIVHEVDASWTSPSPLPTLVYSQSEGGHRVDLERVDLALPLAFLRTTTRRGPALDTLFRRVGPARCEALAAARPRSRAACAARLIMAVAARNELRLGDERRVKEALAAADAATAPGLVPDLSAAYVPDVELELAFVRRCQIDVHLRAGDRVAAAACARQAVEHARRSREGANRADLLRDAWVLEAEAEATQDLERALAAWDSGIADMRARVERTDRQGAPEGIDPHDERSHLAKLLVMAASWVDALAGLQPEQAQALSKRSLTWGEEALALTARFAGHAQGAAGLAIGYVCRRWRLAGRLDEAEALFAGTAPDILHESPEVAREGCELARARGDLATFEARLKAALARFPNNPHLRELAREPARPR